MHRPSPALVVAVIALVVSLGGTAVAASGVLITSSSQIRAGSVRSTDIRDGSIKPRDLTPALRARRGAKGDTGPQGPPGTPGATGRDGIAGLTFSYLKDPVFTQAITYQAIDGLKQSITVPAGRPTRILATLSGESECAGGGADENYCSVRIRVDGLELIPGEGEDFAFDSTNAGEQRQNASWRSLSIQRVSGILAPGPHTVTIEHRVVLGGLGPVTHRFDDAMLTLQQFASAP
jgi:hypothetical protein